MNNIKIERLLLGVITFHWVLSSSLSACSVFSSIFHSLSNICQVKFIHTSEMSKSVALEVIFSMEINSKIDVCGRN